MICVPCVVIRVYVVSDEDFAPKWVPTYEHAHAVPRYSVHHIITTILCIYVHELITKKKNVLSS